MQRNKGAGRDDGIAIRVLARTTDGKQLDGRLEDDALEKLRNGASAASLRAAFLTERRRSVLLINLVSVMERMDEQIVPALSRPLGCAFRVGPHQLGLITFARAVVQAVVCPLGGIAGHFFDRVSVLFVGCVVWGFFCTAFAFSTTINQGIAAWAFNGVGLSLIIPNSQSLVADYYTATQRGEAFGTLMLTGALGGMLGGVFATNLGGMRRVPQLAGLAGWRLVFMSVGAVSAAVGTAALLLAVDPKTRRRASTASPHPSSLAAAAGSVGSGAPLGLLLEPLTGRQGPAGRHTAGFLQSQKTGLGPEGEALLEGTAPEWVAAVGEGCTDGGDSSGGGGVPALTWPRLWGMLTTPTFLIIILQGIVGSTPWNALVFLTLYFQLLGFSDAGAGGLVALFMAGAAAGSLLGGWLGDRVAERHPHHGRIALVQFSVGIGVPLSALLLRGMPLAATTASGTVYGGVLVLMGLLITWAAPACNNPVFAEIVPPDMRNLVYAFDRSFEGALSALGAPLVGMAAERWFGFSGVAAGEGACEELQNTATTTGVSAAGPPPDLAKARSLGDAMLLFMVVPWTLCVIFYTGLHWTYPRDRARALRPQAEVISGA